MVQLNELGSYFRATYGFFISPNYVPSEVIVLFSFVMENIDG